MIKSLIISAILAGSVFIPVIAAIAETAPRPTPPMCDWGNGSSTQRGCERKDENKNPDMGDRGGVPPSYGSGSRFIDSPFHRGCGRVKGQGEGCDRVPQ